MIETMPILRDWTLTITADQAIRGMGADPAAIRQRRPVLVDVAERAAVEAVALAEPAVIYRRLCVEKCLHHRLVLEAGPPLIGELVAHQLGAAEEVVTAVCTLGETLAECVKEFGPVDPVFAMALDGAGNAAIEALATEFCDVIDREAAQRGLQTTMPINPGMEGWPTGEGQEQIFALVDTRPIGVRLTGSALMIPQKSLSLVIGIGSDVRTGGSPCDYCAVRPVCRHQGAHGSN